MVVELVVVVEEVIVVVVVEANIHLANGRLLCVLEGSVFHVFVSLRTDHELITPTDTWQSMGGKGKQEKEEEEDEKTRR